MLRDISEAMEDFAPGGVRAAMLNALEIDGGIGHARISVRESVESVNAMLTELLGVDPTALRTVRFSPTLPLRHRSAFAAPPYAGIASRYHDPPVSHMATR